MQITLVVGRACLQTYGEYGFPPGIPILSYVWRHAQSQLFYAPSVLSADVVPAGSVIFHSFAGYNAERLGLQKVSSLPPYTNLFL